MNDFSLAAERRKQLRLEKLGTNDPRCATCGEADWRCMEAHHIAGRLFDDETVILCWNCHRKVSDDQKDHPHAHSDANALLEAIGHFLLGLADLLGIVVSRLHEFGSALIELSKDLVAPQSGVSS